MEPGPVEGVPVELDAWLSAGLEATGATYAALDEAVDTGFAYFSVTATLEAMSLATVDAAPVAAVAVVISEVSLAAGGEPPEPPETPVAAPHDDGGWMTAG